jgi:hypothetical protein
VNRRRDATSADGRPVLGMPFDRRLSI